MLRVARLVNFRRLRRRPLRVIVSIIAVAAGVTPVVSILVLTTSTTTSLRSFGRQLAGPSPLRVVGATSRGGLDQSVIRLVESTPGVAAAVPVVQAVTFAENSQGRATPVVALGVDCRIEALVGPIGCAPQAIAGATDTTPPLVGSSLVRRLGPAGELRTDLGRLPLRRASAVRGLNLINGGSVTVFALPVAQRLFARPGRLDAIYVKPAMGENVAALRTRLQQGVGGWNGVLSAADPPPGVGVVVAAFVPLFALFSFFVLAIGAVLVFDTVTLSLEDRRRDLAVIGALGGRPSTMIGSTLIEAACLGLVGGLLGAAGGVALAHPLTTSLSDFTQKFVGVPITVHATASAVAVSAALGVVVAAAAAWLPIRRATRMDVAAELSQRDRRSETAPRVGLRRTLVYTAIGTAGLSLCWVAQRHGALQSWQANLAPLGIVVTGVGFLLATGAVAAPLARLVQRLVGRRGGPLRLGLANLVREPGRTAVMVIAVGAAVAAAFILASSRKSIHDAIAKGVTSGNRRELTVSTMSLANTLNVDARPSPNLIGRLTAIPGVARIDGSSSLLTGHDDKRLVGVTAYDNPSLDNFEFVLGRKDLAGFARGEVLVGAALARSRHLHYGSKLRLDTPTGYAWVTVGGVWLDGNFNGRVVDMPMSLFRRLYGDQPPYNLGVVAAPGVSLTDLAHRVVILGLDRDLIVDTPAQLTARASRDVGAQLAPIEALQRTLVFVAVVAVVSTLLLVGVQRRREVGVLEAIGMEPSQLVRMTITEAAAVGILGTVLSVIGGMGMNLAFSLDFPIIIGFRDPLRFVFSSILLWGPIVTVIVVLGALVPALRTSQMEVVTALQYE